MEMDAAQAYELINGVIDILNEEDFQAFGSAKLRVCVAALDSVARWLDVVAEVDEALEP